MRYALIGLSFIVVLPGFAHAQVPAAIAAPGETVVATWHAEGAQVYECKAGADGKLAWAFREPIATLLLDGKTIGRHYAGPTWELIDGSVVSGKIASHAPGASPADIPILNLEVTSRRGQGQLSLVSTIKRLNTRGGIAVGECSAHHALLDVPYTADYAFYRKSGATHAALGE